MNIMLLGAAGFIGTNLAFALSSNPENCITLVDRDDRFFSHIKKKRINGIQYKISNLDCNTDFDNLLKNQDVIYHLVSTTVPTTSNKHISEELKANVLFSSNLFEACIRKGIKKVIFISSGGTVYGKEAKCPLSEYDATNPITSYGVQKITIEKLLYLYNYLYGLDYRIIRLSNPYGPYQRPNGVLGAVTTFTYKALKNENIEVYGDGTVVRDFIYIDDAVRGIINIANKGTHKLYNLGCGYGTSINDVLNTLEQAIGDKLNIQYKESRKVDVPVNFLDINRYEQEFGKFKPIELLDGIRKTISFMKNSYK